jgi:hypothetical protein
MAGWRKAIELAVGEEDLAALRGIARSRTEPASRVERARMLLAYRDEPSFFKVGLLTKPRSLYSVSTASRRTVGRSRRRPR